ncbi:RNA 2',3'-cyclic phosphodiesterase [Paragemmobacter straminiformis]|uniref:RNA 2',3'-cyclic phosphodiesterase n=1 Tax=Paragemmobacter straminiformis TaxID=2045119 RepID=A0A842I2Q3_9RHOB|nr:RNA 2',3'-cyclic phosphodiesterase [Gemmobacter straminiformis]MBC2833931.1 RNA 2',3'-cyclic phosphodiesterase [Gemmobacter straminiformis]
MMRVFLALPLPEAVMSALRVQQFLLPLPKSVEPEGFHLTLVFLGEVQDWALEAAHERFAEVRVPPFELRLQGLGLFGGAKPKAAWAGVAASGPLVRLQAKLERAAQVAGIDCAARKFVPHVTLGRFAPPPPDEAMRLERAVALGGGFATDPWQVDHFCLFQSHLSPKGARYDELFRYDL